MNSNSDQSGLIETGVPGLDDVLGGGLTPSRLYLLEGVPGCGKTTVAMQFMQTGVKSGEPVLYLTLSETRAEMAAVAASHGWSLEGITFREFVPTDQSFDPDEQYTMFHPSEVELSETTRSIIEDVERLRPRRIVFDSLSEFRLLAGSPLRYRRQILALKQYFSGRSCTVLLLDDMTATDHDLQVQSIAHGVILLEQQNPEYGAERRRLRVVKYRGMRFRGGNHDYVIERGGLRVFPRLVAAEHRAVSDNSVLASGIAELDTLLGGGLDTGNSTLIVGPPGTGKSTLAAQFCVAAAHRGQNAAMFIFDESVETILRRCAGMGIDLAQHYQSGAVTIQPIDPAELSPGQLAHAIRDAVDERQAKVIVIDSLNGYLNAMPEERFLTIQLHELLMFLGQRRVATMLVGAQQGLIGMQMTSPVDASYLADSVIMLRYFETRGEVRQAISVVKKRGGTHERTIRELRMGGSGFRIGPPLREFRGVLTGVPTFDPPEKAQPTPTTP